MAIAKCYDKRWTIGSKEAEANAKLIAAAPIMLEVLELCKEYFERTGDSPLLLTDIETAINTATIQ